METKWIKQGGNFKITPSSISIVEELPVAIYTISVDPISREFSLNYLSDKFEFDFELLGLEEKFIKHAIKTYENTTGNFGILLNGVKGTGKTVTAKVLANTLNKPIILVDTAYKGIDAFLASLNFECILFFDEFEKNFDPKEDINILTIMDGIYNCPKRKTFILTTNSLHINDCLLSRPSRIRYKKEFTNVSIEVINALFDKFLKDQSIRNDLFAFVTNLEVCSTDIIKSLISEINIHGIEEFDYIKTIFNIKETNTRYNIITANKLYYSKAVNKKVERNITTVISDIKKFKILKDKYRTPEEDDIFDNLCREGLNWDDSTKFPCKLWDIKKGMFIYGLHITEIYEDHRILEGIDSAGNTRYIYVLPTYNFNSYTGGSLI